MYNKFVYMLFPVNLYTVFKVAPLRGEKSQIAWLNFENNYVAVS